MKLKAVLLAVAFVAGISASLAIAAPPGGRGHTTDTSTTAGTSTNKGHKPQTTGLNCRPKVSLILKGNLLSLGSGSFSMNVTQTNRQALVRKGTVATVNVDAKTKIIRRGPATLAKLVVGDRLVVQVRACKAERETAALLAVRVVATPIKPPSGNTSTGETSTTTS